MLSVIQQCVYSRFHFQKFLKCTSCFCVSQKENNHRFISRNVEFIFHYSIFPKKDNITDPRPKICDLHRVSLWIPTSHTFTGSLPEMRDQHPVSLRVLKRSTLTDFIESRVTARPQKKHTRSSTPKVCDLHCMSPRVLEEPESRITMRP